MLFENKQRTRLGPMQQGEGEYAFYDSCARPGYDTYRGLINGWIARLPEPERASIVARFRAAPYQATLAELVIHEALLRQGFTVDLHPLGGHPTHRLDYLVKSNTGAAVAYVEVTSINPTTEWVARNNREAAIYNALDALSMPAGWRLGYSVERPGADSPSLDTLRTQVTNWVEEAAGNDATATPSRIFDAGEWKIQLTLLGGFDADVVDPRSIVTAMGELRLLTPDKKIRQALQLKGDKYGALNAPYLIVVADCKDELAGGDRNAHALLDAVFGSVGASFVQQADGVRVLRERRLNNGYWGVNGNARHRNVSAVLLLPKPNLWYLRDERAQPLIVRNPWATHPLPDELFPLPSFKITAAGEITVAEGQSLADLLGLPAVWPPEG